MAKERLVRFLSPQNLLKHWRTSLNPDFFSLFKTIQHVLQLLKSMLVRIMQNSTYHNFITRWTMPLNVTRTTWFYLCKLAVLRSMTPHADRCVSVPPRCDSRGRRWSHIWSPLESHECRCICHAEWGAAHGNASLREHHQTENLLELKRSQNHGTKDKKTNAFVRDRDLLGINRTEDYVTKVKTNKTSVIKKSYMHV